MISSELQVLGNWRRSLRTFCLQDSLALGSSELMLIPVDCSCCRVPSCHDLQNFNPLEAGDVHLELLIFSLLWRLVLQNLQVLNAEAVQQNFWSSVFYQALEQKLDLQRLEPFIRTSCPESSDASSASFQNMLMHMIF